MEHGGAAVIVQHMNHLAARIQAVVRKVDAIENRLDEPANDDKSVGTEALTTLKEDIKRDVVRERAMMEASLEHRVDQQMNKLFAEKDQQPVISSLEKRILELESIIQKILEEKSDD